MSVLNSVSISAFRSIFLLARQICSLAEYWTSDEVSNSVYLINPDSLDAIESHAKKILDAVEKIRRT